VHSLRVGAQQLHLGRAWAFTATELSRAAALLELAAQLALHPRARPPSEDHGLLLREGSEVRLREITASDGPLVAALHARCSPQTRRSRFLSPAPQLAPGQLAGLLGGEDGVSRAVLAVTADGGSAVGLATVERPVGACAELAVLVEDAWQRRGLGTALLRRAVEIATVEGADEVTGWARTDDVGVLRVLRRAGLRPTAEIVDGTLRLWAAVPAPITVA
jgi:GNAT superfamily N-acetyltransferase